MDRRSFIKNTSTVGVLLAASSQFLLSGFKSRKIENYAFKTLAADLLKDWCDGMIESQIINPGRPDLHGSLDCPSCDHIHGRCMDAVYPFLYLADTTGEKKYLDAAILVMEWAERNVSHANGSWSVIPDPNSWKGITVFGAIALGEALHYHGHVLSNSLRNKWTKRLGRATEYVYQNFDLTFTNINYGATAIYALHLIGNLLKKDKYIERSRELAKGIKVFFTQPNCFLYGEGKPSDKKSGKGLYAVDLGYNVEESLSNLVLYALEENDKELTELLRKSLNTHLEFMLPDGAWDNSWGTRQFKWSYWGSRTTDGSQLTYACMAGYNPAFATASMKNTELLKACTNNGLLHGGPHYVQHGIPPCIHHTFEHAKPLATLLNKWNKLENINAEAPLPREKDYGIKYYPEIDTTLIARGSWKGTVTAYDAIYYKGDYRQATGGALSVLYHQDLGLLMTASMAKYKLAEKNNQQPNPGEDFALTPRLETYINGEWFTNLYDLTATLYNENKDGVVKCNAKVALKNESLQLVKGTASKFVLDYFFHTDKLIISAKSAENINAPTALVLPIVSQKGEKIEQLTNNEFVIHKMRGKLKLKANVPLSMQNGDNQRIFNMVPGVEAIPIFAYFLKDKQEIDVTLSVL
ncbi:MAG: hypothetical protein K9G70_06565 [Prolixibacteraceae bacterium]|nr:hypothetical protein [Prolixibacteraceae bacterium]